jgi:nitrous oxidase accessory protein NosD
VNDDASIRRIHARVLGATVAVTALLAVAVPGADAAGCDRVASVLGSDAYAGTAAEPYATVERLANSLEPGQTGCLREGIFQGDVKVARGGTAAEPTTITSFGGERATVVGRFRVAEGADNVVVQGIDLDGRNDDDLPSPTINADHVVFRDNDVTNHHTTICFVLGSNQYGRARGALIERNRIHNCGQLPPTNHHHGIYVEASDGARITDNWIYDNADRGVQLYPDAQGTYVARNVIDGNGQGVIFSRESANNVVENNVITNPVVRYNIEDYELTGTGNVARRNCVWSTRHSGNAGIQPGLDLAVAENLVVDPGYVSRPAKDFRLRPGSPCVTFASAIGSRRAKQRTRPVRLRASTAVLWPGGRLRLRAAVKSPSARASASRHAVLKLFRGGKWRQVGVMRLRGSRYVEGVELRAPGRGASRRLGSARVKRHAGVLRLRASVPGTGRSNIVRVRIAVADQASPRGREAGR